MPRILTDEQKEDEYLYVIQWRNLNKDKFKSYQYKVIKEKARKEKTFRNFIL